MKKTLSILGMIIIGIFALGGIVTFPFIAIESDNPFLDAIFPFACYFTWCIIGFEKLRDNLY